MVVACCSPLQAKHLFKCVMSVELTGVAYVEDVLRELETGIETAQQATKANHKVAKVSPKVPYMS